MFSRVTGLGCDGEAIISPDCRLSDYIALGKYVIVLGEVMPIESSKAGDLCI